VQVRILVEEPSDSATGSHNPGAFLMPSHMGRKTCRRTTFSTSIANATPPELRSGSRVAGQSMRCWAHRLASTPISISRFSHLILIDCRLCLEDAEIGAG